MTTSSLVNAQEISWFRMTQIDGRLTSRYFGDEVKTEQGSESSERQRQFNIRQELFINTRSYIYHPNLLDLHLSGGPIYESSSLNINDDKTDQSAKLYSIVARANILQEKPYRSALFYERLNPTLQVGFGETAISTNTRHGLELSLSEVVTPIPINIEWSQSNNKTSGTNRIINDRVNRLSLRSSRTLGQLGSSTLRAFSTRQESLSGNPNQPIQSARLQSDGLDLHTRLRFGANNKHELNNTLSFSRESVAINLGAVPDRSDFRFSTDIRSQLSKQMRSFTSLSHTSNSQGTLDTTTNRLAASLDYQPNENLFTRAGLRGNQSTSDQISTELFGVNGLIRYDHKLPIGVATLSYATSYDRQSQESINNRFDIIDESIIFNGLTPIALSKTRVFNNSIVISNTSRSQVFIEGLDYALSVVGLTTRIERLSGGNILNGEQVLVDYAVNAGGTFRSTQMDQTFSARWRLSNYIEAGYQYSSSRPELTSGFAGFQLNRFKSHLLTLRGEYPLLNILDLRMGGNIEHESRIATADSFERETGELYIQTSLPFFTAANLRVGLRRTLLSHDDTQNDSDLRAIDIRFGSRHKYGIHVSLDASYEEDLQKTRSRRRFNSALRARGGFRKFRIEGELAYVKEQQGNFDRSRLHGQLTMTREF